MGITLPKDMPGKDYPFQYWFDHQDLFRPLIFKHYHPQWHTLWKPLEHLVDEFEANERHGVDRDVTLHQGDDVHVMMLLEKSLSKNEMIDFENQLKTGRVKDKLANAFCCSYRKHYPEALKHVQDEYWRSDYRYFHEFLAHKFGKVPRVVPYQKRLHGQLLVTPDSIQLVHKKH